MKAYPAAISGNLDSVHYYVDSINAISLQIGEEEINNRTKTLLELTYKQMGEREESIKFSLEKLALHKKQGTLQFMTYDLQNISSGYLHLKRYDLAIPYFMENLAINQKLNDDYGKNSKQKKPGRIICINRRK